MFICIVKGRETINNLDKILYEALIDMGIAPSLKGYATLTQAIKMVYNDPSLIYRVTTDLYPDVGKACSCSAWATERSIRYAIEYAIEHTSPEILHKYLGSAIHSKSGTVHNSVFISLMAEYLKFNVDDELW